MKGIHYAADSVRLRQMRMPVIRQRQFQATGGDFAKLFNVQNKKFITISCRQCGYTELYRAQTGTGMNVLDFLVG